MCTHLIIFEVEVEGAVVDLRQTPVTEVVSVNGGGLGCESMLGSQTLRVHCHYLHTSHMVRTRRVFGKILLCSVIRKDKKLAELHYYTLDIVMTCAFHTNFWATSDKDRPCFVQ